MTGKRLIRIAAVALGLGSVAAVGVTGRSALIASLAELVRLRWIWIPAVIVGESASMAAFAFMMRRLVAAGGIRLGSWPMMATTYAANALSVSVPLAGPGVGTAFTFRRFTRQGADAPLASWSLLAGGVVSSAAVALLVVAAGTSSGNGAAIAVAVPLGLLGLGALIGVGVAARRPRLREALERPTAWLLRLVERLSGRAGEASAETVRSWSDRLGALRLPASGWVTVTGLALANLLADAAVFALSIHATGAIVPWRALLLVYASGLAAKGLNLTPGGLGVTEGTLGLGLIAAGLHSGQAFAAVLLYRFASFWLVAVAGWLVFGWLRRRGRARPADTSPVLRAPQTPAGKARAPIRSFP